MQRAFGRQQASPDRPASGASRRGPMVGIARLLSTQPPSTMDTRVGARPAPPARMRQPRASGQPGDSECRARQRKPIRRAEEMSARASGALADIVDEADRPAEFASSSARGRHSGPQASGDDRRGVEDHSNERGRRPSLVVDCTGEPRPGILRTGGGRECGAQWHWQSQRAVGVQEATPQHTPHLLYMHVLVARHALPRVRQLGLHR